MTKLSIHNKRNKEYFATDVFTQTQLKLARMRLEKAIGWDGTIKFSLVPNLLSSKNAKIEKSNNEQGYLTVGQMFSPSFSTGYNMCSHATYCAMVCLDKSGHGQRHMMKGENHYTTQARMIRTLLFMEHRAEYLKRLIMEIKAHVRKAQKLGLKPAIRLNTISDVQWEKVFPFLFALFPEVIFYDYTAIPNRDVSHIPNYHLVFSRKEDNEDVALSQPLNIAIPFLVKKGEALPKTYKGLTVVDADKHDMIWKWTEMYPNEQVILGLRPKGKDAWNDTSGFVVDPYAESFKEWVKFTDNQPFDHDWFSI